MIFISVNMLKIFYIKLTEGGFLARPTEWYEPYVDESTYVSALKFRSDKVRVTKLAGEWLVRHLLGRFWNLGKADFTIVRGEQGKPYVNGRMGVYFNISHSGDYVVCVVSDSEVGVDIEKIGVARMNVARRFFHPLEVCQLESLEGERQSDLFFNYWTVKESFLKYTGSGLSCPLSSFEVRFAETEISLYRSDTVLSGVSTAGTTPLYIRECRIDAGYKCFVTSEQETEPDVEQIGCNRR